MTRDNGDGRHPVRCRQHRRICGDRIGRGRDIVPIIAQHRDRHVAWVNEQAARDGRYRVSPIGERGDDAEIAAAAPERPEQVGILGRADRHQLAAGGNHFKGHDIVAGRPVATHQPADAAPQGQPGDPGFRDNAKRHGQPMEVSFAIDVTKCRASLHAHDAFRGIHEDATHVGEIYDQPTIAERPPGNVVPTAAYSDQSVMFGSELDRLDDIRHAATPHDQTGVPVYHGIPDPPRPVVVRIVRSDEPAGEIRRQSRNRFSRDRMSGAVHQCCHCRILPTLAQYRAT